MIITINDDLTSHIVNADNSLECFLPAYNPETQMPFGNEAEVNAFARTIGANPNYFSRVLTEEEKAAAAEERLATARGAMSVTMRQARQALLAAGHLVTVSDAIAAMTGEAGQAAQIDWEFAATVVRNDSLTQALATVLELWDEQVDDLFIAAAAI